MAIANFDEIIRRLLGLNKPPPDVAQPFVEEEEPQTYKELQRALQGDAQQLPYYPGQDKQFVGPMIIPNTTRQDVEERGPNAPLQKGNAKYGSGIDI